jgi:hypothetical protein
MPEQQNISPDKRLTPLRRALIEVGSIVFLFYSNLLMGEYNHSGAGHKNGLVWALNDIFTVANFSIAIVTGIIGYFIFELLRRRL